VIKKYYKGNYIKREDCNKILELSENLVDEFVPVSENNLEALHEAIRLDCSAYDMLYLTLAQRTGAVLLTLDKPLNAIAEKEGIEIIIFCAFQNRLHYLRCQAQSFFATIIR
jgi:predicted nucleic acid-binding protein